MQKYINKTTNTYPVSEQDIRSANPNTSFTNPFVAPDEYALVFPTPQPSFDSITEQCAEVEPELTTKGNYEQRWLVSVLPEEVIEANQAAKALQLEKLLQQKIDVLWSAADKYVSSYISGIAVGILTLGVLQQKPKALAVQQWSRQVWGEYYIRKALVTPNSQDNLDFSEFGSIPYSVPELQAELEM